MFRACAALPLDDSQSNSVYHRIPKYLPQFSTINLIPRTSSDCNPAHGQSHDSAIIENHSCRSDNGTHTLANTEKIHHNVARVSRRGRGGSEHLPSQPIPGKSVYDLSSKTIINFGLIVPTVRAAEYIEDFFNIIALRIETGYWANEAPSNHRVIRMWDFELEFYSLSSIIPWDFIQDYVLDMMDYISKGFTGVYNEHMVGTINGVVAVVSVGFRLLRRDFQGGLS